MERIGNKRRNGNTNKQTESWEWGGGGGRGERQVGYTAGKLQSSCHNPNHRLHIFYLSKRKVAHYYLEVGQLTVLELFPQAES